MEGDVSTSWGKSQKFKLVKLFVVSVASPFVSNLKPFLFIITALRALVANLIGLLTKWHCLFAPTAS